MGYCSYSVSVCMPSTLDASKNPWHCLEKCSFRLRALRDIADGLGCNVFACRENDSFSLKCFLSIGQVQNKNSDQSSTEKPKPHHSTQASS